MTYFMESRGTEIPVSIIGRTFAGGRWQLVVSLPDGHTFTALGIPVFSRDGGTISRQNATDTFLVV